MLQTQKIEAKNSLFSKQAELRKKLGLLMEARLH